MHKTFINRFLIMQTNYNGSEIHRLKPMRDYDPKVFQRMYKICKPVIRNLVRQIDVKRFNLTPDIIQSYFWDKMLFVFNKYYGTDTEEHLKAQILSSLSTYKSKLLRYAYTEKASYYQNQLQLEDLFDNDKELVDNTEEIQAHNDMWEMLNNYMNEHLNTDAKLVWEVMVTPPPYIKERIKDGARITNLMLVEFFNMPRTRSSVRYFTELKEDIKFWLDKAKKELHY